MIFGTQHDRRAVRFWKENLMAFFCETNRIEKTMLIGYNFYISVDGIY